MPLIRISFLLCALVLSFGARSHAQELRNRVLAQSASGAFKVTAMRSFDTATVVSVVTGRTLTDISSIHALITFMIGHRVLNVNLGHHRPAAAEAILQQYPELKSFDGSAINRDNAEWWTARIRKTYGASLVLVRAR